jgi:hypothetical protein
MGPGGLAPSGTGQGSDDQPRVESLELAALLLGLAAKFPADALLDKVETWFWAEPRTRKAAEAASEHINPN